MATPRNRAQRLNGLFPLSYMGVNPVSPQNFVIYQRPPTINDSKNFYIGDLWLDNGTHTTPGAEDIWMLVALVGNNATWVNFASGAIALETLTGNTGGAVSGDVNDNINVLGDTTTITVAGNPGTNTLTISTAGSVATSYPTDSGIAVPVAGVLNVLTQNATLGCGSSVLFSAPGSTDVIQLDVTDSSTNTIVGSNAGNLTLSGSNNVGLGGGVLSGLTTGNRNTCIGTLAGFDITTANNCTAVGYNALSTMDQASSNTAIGANSLSSATGVAALSNTALGSGSLSALTSGSENTAIGEDSLSQLLTGTNNVAVGMTSGLNYAGAESNNILIDNGGTIGESNTIRIGSTQTSCYVQGIAGVSVSNQQTVVIDTMTGQLGSIAGGNAVAGENLFIATWDGSVVYADMSGTSQIYFLGTASPDGSGNAAMITLYDPDAVFYGGDGMIGGVPASFTAPADGVYQFMLILSGSGLVSTAIITFNGIATSATYPLVIPTRMQFNTSGSFDPAYAPVTCNYVFRMIAGDTITWSMEGGFSVFNAFTLRGYAAPNLRNYLTGWRLN